MDQIQGDLAYAEYQARTRASQAQGQKVVMGMVKNVAESRDKVVWYDDLLRQLGPWFVADHRKWVKAMRKLNYWQGKMIEDDRLIREWVQTSADRRKPRPQIVAATRPA